MQKVIDFTKMRLNSTPRHKACPITRCEKCGRKGELVSCEPKNGKQMVMWDHAGKLVNVCGIVFFEITDSCMMTKKLAPSGE
jgi:hypothetical protein